jgi:hypothetical protein
MQNPIIKIKTSLYATISAWHLFRHVFGSPLNIFIHVILEDGPYGPKHVVTIIRA